jgi:hypothetical protein
MSTAPQPITRPRLEWQRGSHAGHTLPSAALTHEADLRLVRQDRQSCHVRGVPA